MQPNLLVFTLLDWLSGFSAAIDKGKHVFTLDFENKEGKLLFCRLCESLLHAH